MKRNIICIMMAALMLLAVSCGKKADNVTSSKVAKPESEIAKVETTSQNESKVESKVESKKEVSAKTDISSTTSKSVKKTISDFLELGIYHLNPKFCKNYGYNTSDSVEEFEDAVKAGYVNSVFIAKDQILNFDILKIAKQYDLKLWISLGDWFDSRYTTIDSYVNNIADSLDTIKSMDGGYYELIQGFHFDEPFWRGQSNRDFLIQTEALYKKFGLRIYPVYAGGEVTNAYAAKEPDIDRHGWAGFETSCMKYVTDAGLDNYRLNTKTEEGRKEYISLYEKMCSVIGHDVNIWFFPCTYQTTWVEGETVDEDYMIDQLNFFLSIKDNYKNLAGFYLYNYMGHDNGTQFGLEHFLVLKDKDGVQRPYPNEQKYTRLSALIKETCQSFRKTKANLIKKI